MRCHGLVHIYTDPTGDEVVALRGVDLEVAAGERVVLLGPSGAGKSTLLNLLGGVNRATAGLLEVDGAELRVLTETQLVRLRATRLGTVLQGPARNLLPYATPEQNVAFAQRADPRRGGRGLMTPMALLDALGLGPLRRRRLLTLSGGELQRVAVAVAVANAPGLLLADEPTSQLGREHKDMVLELLEEVSRRWGTTVVVVSHDLAVASRWHRTVTIRDGRVGAEGRHGHDLAVVGRDGAVQLPDRFRTTWTPGTLVAVDEVGDGTLRLRRETS